MLQLNLLRLLGKSFGPRFARESERSWGKAALLLQSFSSSWWKQPFRAELNEEELEFYVERHLAAEPDDAEAIKRVCFVTLKSPRFLYPTADSFQSKSQKVANRLSLILFDSLPVDGWLRPDALKGEFESEGLVRAYAEKYVDDPRVRGKVRELMHAWLNLGHLTGETLTKAEGLYAEFEPELQYDLRRSLDAFLDDVIWSERSDFRDLFLSKSSFTTNRIGKYYGGPWESESNELTRTKEVPEIHGLLNHPFLMSGLAYHDSTSPIHRGVFLIRYMLGRTLRPPSEAFTPLSPDLHPDLTTRERVDLQTSPESCQVCHYKINGLGFCLENYDAVGRFRDKEHEKTIDPTGSYVATNGDEVKFSGVADLAKYLAQSEDARRAFVSRAFQHLVKQPPAAYGADTLDTLVASFDENECSIRKLIVEIAVTALKPVLSETSVAEPFDAEFKDSVSE